MLHPHRTPRPPLAFTVLLVLPLGWAGTALAADHLVAEDIAVFAPADYDASQALPSAALVRPLADTGPVPGAWRLRPAWSVAEGPYVAPVTFAREGALPPRHRMELSGYGPGVDLYGTGEQAGPLRRNGTTALLYANDNYQYQRGPHLYQTHPWVLGVRPDGSAFGILADTYARGEIDLRGDRIRMEFEGAPFRTIVIEKSSPQAVVQTLATLTGTMELPPAWALGYHQCRWSYLGDAEAREIVAGFRSRHIPCDVLWFDIDYMDGFRIFTFDKTLHPDPAATNAFLHGQGFHSVWMIDPAPKSEPGYPVFDAMTSRGLYVAKGPGPQFYDPQDQAAIAALRGVPPDMYVGKVWPGYTGFPDFTMATTSAWWAGLYRDFMATGVDGVWNDMNEPAVFNRVGTMPDDCRHRGGLALATGTLPPGTHDQYHNLYGMLMMKATRDGIVAANPDKRPFVLSRSSHLGGQRYGATWTGDNSGTDEHRRLATPMCLNLGLSGQPFVGPDLGGFAGKEMDPAVYARWISAGAFYPFMRGHAEKNGPRKEPWAFGPEIEATAKVALERRYRLLPYLGTAFREAATSGLPVMRPVFFADPTDPALRAEDQAFLCGPDLLVIPDGASGAHLPRGAWRDLPLVPGDDGRYQATLRLRPGAIVPAGPVQEWVGQRPLDELTLYANLDDQGTASGQLYEDAGEGFAYRDGGYRLTTWQARRQADGTVQVTVTATAGQLPAPARRIRLGVVGADRQVAWTDVPR